MTHQDDGVNVSELGGEASDWFVRLQAEDAGADDWLAFERWLGEDPAHEAAFRKVEAAWVDLDAAPSAASLSAHPVGHTAQIIPLPVRARPARRRWRLPVAIAASVAVVVGAAGVMTVVSPRRAPAPASGLARARDIPIPGGGSIHVDAGTTLSLRRSGARIEAAMGPGRALFTVPHDPRRRFIVRAGAQTITDIGTRFDVQRDDMRLRVAVADGEVAESDSDPDYNVLRVSAGQSAVSGPGEGGARLLLASGAPIQKVYDRATLGQVVGDLNRIYARPVRLAPGCAELSFTGALIMDSQDAVLHRLAAFLDLEVAPSPTAVLLSKAASTPR